MMKVKYGQKSYSVYILLVVAVLVALALLPFFRVDSVVQCRGFVCSNADVSSSVSVGVVKCGDEVSQLGDSVASLMAECYVSPSDVSLVAVGQHVTLHYDGFDYRQWGFGNAEVVDVGDSLHVIDSCPVFVVKCRLLDVSLKHGNGMEAHIVEGLLFTGYVSVANKSLLRLLVD